MFASCSTGITVDYIGKGLPKIEKDFWVFSGSALTCQKKIINILLPIVLVGNLRLCEQHKLPGILTEEFPRRNALWSAERNFCMSFVFWLPCLDYKGQGRVGCMLGMERSQ